MALFEVSGTVKPFVGNGRKFGYPTANIEIPVDTPEGLFVGYTELNGALLPSIIFIGAPVTLDDEIKRAETHILDFEDRDLYGEEITMSITKKLRDNHKYDSIEALIEQMKIDETIARDYFKTKGA